MTQISYKWSWRRLSLWKNTDYDDGGSSSSRIFTLWPPWLIQNAWLRLRYGPDPYEQCYRWLKKSGHWDDEDFMRAVCWWYANHSEPGQLARLNPKLFL